MKIVNECEFETKLIKDLEHGEIFMLGSFPYMKISAVDNHSVIGYPAIKWN